MEMTKPPQVISLHVVVGLSAGMLFMMLRPTRHCGILWMHHMGAAIKMRNSGHSCSVHQPKPPPDTTTGWKRTLRWWALHTHSLTLMDYRWVSRAAWEQPHLTLSVTWVLFFFLSHKWNHPAPWLSFLSIRASTKKRPVGNFLGSILPPVDTTGRNTPVFRPCHTKDWCYEVL